MISQCNPKTVTKNPLKSLDCTTDYPLINWKLEWIEFYFANVEHSRQWCINNPINEIL